MISYAILVSDEDAEFNRLITYLARVKDREDEIVVLVDSSKTNDRIKTILINNSSNIVYGENPLNGDFSAQKNLLFSMCTKEYIVNLDADEMISVDFISNLKEIIKTNPDIEAFWIPRWNEVTGITDKWISTWGWTIDSLNRINWPDLQMRVLKNNPNIKWSGSVHEQLTGYSSYAILPLERDYSIFHIKPLEKQIAQNEFYGKIKNG
jgi:glycosyltransferase involved in cell wall biosynthesis